jgi:hypothetical protein
MGRHAIFRQLVEDGRLMLGKTQANPLEKYFQNHQGRLIHKWLHYFEVYDRHFSRFRGKPVTILEFGVSHGGSLQMWKHYFGKKAQITGVDIDPRCKNMEEKNIKVYIGDQEDRDFLRRLAKQLGEVDIVIEDGGHTMLQQINTFEEIYPIVKQNGVFLTEDTHTSYWKSYGGGYKKPGTFMEYAKDLTDQLNSWHSENKEKFKVSDFTCSTKSMHFYDSIVVFEKGLVSEPHHEQRGKPSF